MSHAIEPLFANNRNGSERMHAEAPEFRARLVRLQSPEYLWIGCSDSRLHAGLDALSVTHCAVERYRDAGGRAV